MKIYKVPKILIIEKNLIIAADISIQLQVSGYDIMGIHQKVEDALVTIENSTPDIVLMGIFLGEKTTGIDLAKRLNNTIQTPVIFISANINEEVLIQVAEAKPYAFISKPFKKEDLQKAVQFTLHRKAIENNIISDKMRFFAIENNRLFKRK